MTRILLIKTQKQSRIRNSEAKGKERSEREQENPDSYQNAQNLGKAEKKRGEGKKRRSGEEKSFVLVEKEGSG
ncbi:MAG: hypothetical protein J6D37_02315 [Clostridia bacterium]|nr:hypothetical protein [Clostridia bacterium]